MQTSVFLLEKDMFQGKFDLVYRFYYGRLNTKQKKCYEVIVRNALQYNKEFTLPYCLTEEEIAETFCAMMDDYPLFFFVNSYYYRITGNTMIFRITYRILEKNVQPLLDSIMKEVTPFVKSIQNRSEEEKELAVHDYLAKNVLYEKDRSYYVHQIIGAVLHKKSVCEGFARTAKMLFDLLGMRSVYVTGYGNCYGGQKGGAHAWNIVFIKNVPYYLDITFDNSYGKSDISYEYFNLSDKQIARNHRLDKVLVHCPEGGDYYTVRGLYLQRKSQLKELVRKNLIAGKKQITFRMDFSRPLNELTRNAVDVILEVCRENPLQWSLKRYWVYEQQYIFKAEFR